MAVERAIARHLRAVSGARNPRSDRTWVAGNAASPIQQRYQPGGVEYLVRTARITDIDRLVALSGPAPQDARDGGPMDAADLLRTLVYLPQASIFVAEARREVVGGAVLALRPSVRAGGYVGTVDFLVVDPQHDEDRVSEALIDELLRSAGNKGCTVVEAVRPDDPAARTRWERHGFAKGRPQIERAVAAVGVTARRAR